MQSAIKAAVAGKTLWTAICDGLGLDVVAPVVGRAISHVLSSGSLLEPANAGCVANSAARNCLCANPMQLGGNLWNRTRVI